MALTPEQAKEIKKQLFSQIDQLPQENKEQIKQSVAQLNEKQLEQFLKQNNIQLSQQSSEINSSPQKPKCIFCSIINNETPSYKIAENKKSMAILEINPLSKGHSLIIPFEHTTIEKLPKSSLTLAQKIAKKLKTKLKPEDVKIETSSFQGHSIINIVPFYKDIPPEKKQASEQELKELHSKLETKKRSSRKTKKKIILTKEQISKLPEISFRIP